MRYTTPRGSRPTDREPLPLTKVTENSRCFLKEKKKGYPFLSLPNND